MIRAQNRLQAEQPREGERGEEEAKAATQSKGLSEGKQEEELKILRQLCLLNFVELF